MKYFKILLKQRLAVLIIIVGSISAQIYIPADPFDLLFTEQKIMLGGGDPGSLMIRPVIIPKDQLKDVWSLKVRNEVYYNSGAPNLENTSDRWIGKGTSFFAGWIEWFASSLAGSLYAITFSIYLVEF